MSTPSPIPAALIVPASDDRISFGVRLSNAAYGWLMGALFKPSHSPPQLRANFERFAGHPREKLSKRYPQVVFEDFAVGALRGERIRAVPNPTRVLLYLHGGGYVFGSVATYRRRALQMSFRFQAEVIVPEYRLAPEHPFPCALDDAVSAWAFGFSIANGRPCFVAGDSAGGGLALSLTVALRDRGSQLPAGVIAISPWADLTLTGATYETNAKRDCWITRPQLSQWADFYRGEHPATHPLISPLFAELHGLPPLLLLAGDQEVLLDDMRQLAVRARAAGTPVQEVIGRGMQHDWMLTLPWLAESKQAWSVMRAFIAGCVPIDSSERSLMVGSC